MLVLAYCAGLRIGEIVRLNVGDVDLEERAIEIRGTKFFKSRRLPLSRQRCVNSPVVSRCPRPRRGTQPSPRRVCSGINSQPDDIRKSWQDSY